MNKEKLDSIFTALNSIKKSFMELGEDSGFSGKKYPKMIQSSQNATAHPNKGSSLIEEKT